MMRRDLSLPSAAGRCGLLVAAITFCGMAAAQPASTGSGQAYPSKSIRLLVPFPPGGGVDAVARIAFQRVGEQLQQPIVIDNRGGSSGIIATELAARAVPDGYTLFFGVTSALAILPHYQRKLPYDVLKDRWKALVMKRLKAAMKQMILAGTIGAEYAKLGTGRLFHSFLEFLVSQNMVRP